LFVDAKHLEDGTAYKYDLCIIGAGAAGISIARKLKGRSAKVCVLEGGGLEPDLDSQRLYDGELAGLPYFSLDSCRLRYFGGTTNHWAGYCWPLQATTFAAKSWIPYSGWPIGQRDLAPYYDEAADLLGLSKKSWSPKSGWDLSVWEKIIGEYRINFDERYFHQISTHIKPVRMGIVFRNELERAPEIDVFLNANVTNLDTGPDSNRVKNCNVRTFNGRNLTFSARIFVLAAGGIENARLLLLSDRYHDRGLGNQNDLVGRFFMDHVSTPIGTIQLSDKDAPIDIYSQYRNRPALRDMQHIVSIVANEEMEEKFKLVPIWVRVLPKLEEFWTSDGPISLKSIRESIADGSWPADFDDHLGNVLSDLGSVAKLLRARSVYDGHSYESAEVRANLAPAPNRDSRITLSGNLDELGLRRVRLNWQLSEIDFRSVRWIAHRFAIAVGASEVGRMKVTITNESDFESKLRGTWHHIGTTRMATAEKDGVVDANCKVHGVANLYIMGSSVFPTCGSGSPTLAIIALAHRLSNHLLRSGL
jgi:choline dehydrogenase-like flavoprotein